MPSGVCFAHRYAVTASSSRASGFPACAIGADRGEHKSFLSALGCTRLGAYEILTLLGSGGMGEVYRARDTKLNRDVAIKVLPEIFAADPERLARFHREAQLLASLNHPHIGGIYGLEESNGLRALVLELVEGSTLADRIPESPIPVDEALPIARQIAEALGAGERTTAHAAPRSRARRLRVHYRAARAFEAT